MRAAMQPALLNDCSADVMVIYLLRACGCEERGKLKWKGRVGEVCVIIYAVNS